LLADEITVAAPFLRAFLKNHFLRPLQASGKDISGVVEALNAIAQSLSAQ
jgi:hypothetical protein